MTVPVQSAASGAAFAYGVPAPLLDVSRYGFFSLGRTYDVAPGDARFVFVLPAGASSSSAESVASLEVIVNWMDEVRPRVESR